MKEQPISDERLNDAIEVLEFDSENAQLHVKAHSHLVRIDGTAWLDRKEATVLRDWLNEVLQ